MARRRSSFRSRFSGYRRRASRGIGGITRGVGPVINQAAQGLGKVDMALLAVQALSPQSLPTVNTPEIRTVANYLLGGKLPGAAVEAYRTGLLNNLTGMLGQGNGNGASVPLNG